MEIKDFDYYESRGGSSPVIKYIKGMTFVDQKKFLKSQGQMKDPEFLRKMLKTKDIKDIKGESNKGLFELRKLWGHRFFFFVEEMVCRIVHVIKKQGDGGGTPPYEIAIARQRMLEWLNADKKNSK
jgi:hypothetical protein